MNRTDAATRAIIIAYIFAFYSGSDWSGFACALLWAFVGFLDLVRPVDQ